MSVQNNKKGEQQLDDETKKLLDTPIPDDAELPTTDPIDDKIDDPNEPSGDTDENEEEEVTEEEETEEESEEEDKGEEGEEDKPKDKPKKTLPEDAERLKEQRREAELLNEQRKQIVSAAEEADKVTDVTDEELKEYVRAKGGDWEMLSDFEKGMAKDSLIAKKKQDIMNKGLTAIRDVDKWADSVDKFLEEHETKQTYKQLIGREQEFRQFAMKASHRGVGFEYLVPSFLFNIKDTAKKKGSLLLHGGGNAGGDKPKTTPADVMTDAAEVARLRTQNPQEYRRKLREHKIKISVE